VATTPETKFAWNGDVSLAYQVVGEGPVDLVYLQGYASNVALSWDEVLVSETIRNLVAGSGMAFDERGRHRLKGVPDEWQIWAVRS
jgi:class 3 adenylate cyclase